MKKIKRYYPYHYCLDNKQRKERTEEAKENLRKSLRRWVDKDVKKNNSKIVCSCMLTLFRELVGEKYEDFILGSIDGFLNELDAILLTKSAKDEIVKMIEELANENVQIKKTILIILQSFYNLIEAGFIHQEASEIMVEISEKIDVLLELDLCRAMFHFSRQEKEADLNSVIQIFLTIFNREES